MSSRSPWRRHAVDDAAGLVLNHREATGGPQRRQPLGAVPTHSTQHDSGAVSRRRFRDRQHELVHRRTMTVARRGPAVEPEDPILAQEKVGVPWREAHASRVQPLAIVGYGHLQPGLGGQPSRQAGLEPCRDVLDDADSQVGPLAQSGQELAQRSRPSGGGPDREESQGARGLPLDFDLAGGGRVGAGSWLDLEDRLRQRTGQLMPLLGKLRFRKDRNRTTVNGGKGGGDLFSAGPRRDHEDRRRPALGDSVQGLESGHSGHVQIHHDGVRPEPEGLRHGLIRLGYLTHDLDTEVPAEEPPQQRPDGCRALGNQDAGRAHCAPPRRWTVSTSSRASSDCLVM